MAKSVLFESHQLSFEKVDVLMVGAIVPSVFCWPVVQCRANLEEAETDVAEDKLDPERETINHSLAQAW
jgi:hypothetical protein